LVIKLIRLPVLRRSAIN